MIRFLLLLSAVGLAAAPPPEPTGGIIERQLQEEYNARPLDEREEIPHVEIDLPKEQLHIPPGGCVEVERIEVRGASCISESEIQRAVCEFEGRKLCMEEIYALCRKISEILAKKGYFLARAYPPPQTIKDGVLIIEVIEGRLGKIQVEGNQHYSTRFIESYFKKFQEGPLNYDDFMRAILLLNENKDLDSAAIFVKGEKRETADVIIRVKDKRPMHLYLNANNYGRRLTTSFRAGGRFDKGNLFTEGDLFSLVEVVGFPMNELYFTNAIYKLPLNRNGTFLEFLYLYSFFTIPEFSALQMKGNSNIGTVKATHAITRSKSLRVDGFCYFDFIQIKNLSLGTTTSYDKLRVFRGGVTIDGVGSPTQRHYLNTRVSVGIPNFLGGMPAVSDRCSRQGAGGLFVKLNGDYDFLQNFWTDHILSFHASGQLSAYKLAVPEEVYLGGADTVRGFPLAVVLGDSGYYANLELKIPPPILANLPFFMAKKKWREVVQLVGFLDQGGAFFYGGTDNFLWGTGFGLRVRGPVGLSFSLDVGYPLNHKNLATSPMIYMKITGQPF